MIKTFMKLFVLNSQYIVFASLAQNGEEIFGGGYKMVKILKIKWAILAHYVF